MCTPDCARNTMESRAKFGSLSDGLHQMCELFHVTTFRSRTLETLSHHHVGFDEHIEQLSDTHVAVESNVIGKTFPRHKVFFTRNENVGKTFSFCFRELNEVVATFMRVCVDSIAYRAGEKLVTNRIRSLNFQYSIAQLFFI